MTPAAERQRAYRARRRNGQMCITIPIDAVSVPIALVEAGLLAPGDVDDPKAIAAALGRAIIRIDRYA